MAAGQLSFASPQWLSATLGLPTTPPPSQEWASSSAAVLSPRNSADGKGVSALGRGSVNWCLRGRKRAGCRTLVGSSNDETADAVLGDASGNATPALSNLLSGETTASASAAPPSSRQQETEQETEVEKEESTLSTAASAAATALGVIGGFFQAVRKRLTGGGADSAQDKLKLKLIAGLKMKKIGAEAEADAAAAAKAEEEERAAQEEARKQREVELAAAVAKAEEEEFAAQEAERKAREEADVAREKAARAAEAARANEKAAAAAAAKAECEQEEAENARLLVQAAEETRRVAEEERALREAAEVAAQEEIRQEAVARAAERRTAALKKPIGDPKAQMVLMAKTTHTPFEYLDEYGQLDPFEVLGLPFLAGREDVRTSYIRVCRIHHPDRNGGRESPEWLMARWAYEQLMDTENATAYATRRVLRNAVSVTGDFFFGALSIMRKAVIALTEVTFPILQYITKVVPALPSITTTKRDFLPSVDEEWRKRKEAMDERKKASSGGMEIEPLFNLEVKVKPGQPPVVLCVHATDDPSKVADEFAAQHGLSDLNQRKLVNLLAQQLEARRNQTA